jgi:hypothetical protein
MADYEDSPAAGSHERSPAAGVETPPPAAPGELGRARPSLHELATEGVQSTGHKRYASYEEELADRESGLSRLHDLAKREDVPELSDSDYAEEAHKSIQGLLDQGHAHIDSHGDLIADDLGDEDQTRLRTMLDEKNRIEGYSPDAQHEIQGERSYDPQENPDTTNYDIHSGIEQNIANTRAGIEG